MTNAYVLAKMTGAAHYQENLFGMQPCPPRVLLKREVLRWLQTLDLTHSVRNIRRDAANGFLVAEVCSRYYPSEITMHSFSTGQSNASKRDNWEQLEKFFKRAGVIIGKDLIVDTIAAVEGAAVEIIEILYTAFTQRQVQQLKMPEPTEGGASDPLAGTWKKQFSRTSGVGAESAREGGKNALGQALTPGSKPVTLRAANIPSVHFGNVQVSKMDEREFLRKSMQRAHKAK